MIFVDVSRYLGGWLLCMYYWNGLLFPMSARPGCWSQRGMILCINHCIQCKSNLCIPLLWFVVCVCCVNVVVWMISLMQIYSVDLSAHHCFVDCCIPHFLIEHSLLLAQRASVVDCCIRIVYCSWLFISSLPGITLNTNSFIANVCHPKQHPQRKIRWWYPWARYVLYIPCFHICILSPLSWCECCVVYSPYDEDTKWKYFASNALSAAYYIHQHPRWLLYYSPHIPPFPLALVYRLSNFRMLMLLGYITFIYPTNCIDVNIELYRVSIHNHRMTTGSNVLPTESFIPSHTHIHSSCCYLVDCLYNHVHWHHHPLALLSHV